MQIYDLPGPKAKAIIERDSFHLTILRPGLSVRVDRLGTDV
jgi:hypothetical protein